MPTADITESEHYSVWETSFDRDDPVDVAEDPENYTMHIVTKTGTQARRAVPKVERASGDLFPRVGFIVTNLRRSDEGLVKFFNGRGTAKQWMKEGKNTVRWTRFSCYDLADQQIRSQLFVLGHDLRNFLRRLALPRSVKHGSSTTLREQLVKIGAKVVTHARYVTFQMAKVAIPRRLFEVILHHIRRSGSLMPAPTLLSR